MELGLEGHGHEISTEKQADSTFARHIGKKLVRNPTSDLSTNLKDKLVKTLVEKLVKLVWTICCKFKKKAWWENW